MISHFAHFFEVVTLKGLFCTRAGLLYQVTGLWNRGPLKVLNGFLLVLDDQGDSFRISLESIRSYRGPLFHKPVTGLTLFFATWYKKPGSSFSNFLLHRYWIMKMDEVIKWQNSMQGLQK
jgi:hypothetical protein